MLSRLDTVAAGFLVASPTLRDPNFDHAVVLMCMHSTEGAMGLVINRAAPLNLGELLNQLGLGCTSDASKTVLIGGPVALQSGVLLYQAAAGSAHRDDEIIVSDDLRLTPSQDMLRDIAAGGGPGRYQLVLGHAGWAAGQLEREIAEGSWIPARLELDLIFDTPLDKRWEATLRNEGLHPAALSGFRHDGPTPAS